MESAAWYLQLVKPLWAPPAWAFEPIWLFLYTLILISFGTVFYKVYKKKLPTEIAIPFVLNIIFNITFINVHLGLHNDILASIDILMVLGTLIWATLAIYPRIRWIAYAQIPYLIWLSFLTTLQLSITYLNW